MQGECHCSCRSYTDLKHCTKDIALLILLKIQYFSAGNNEVENKMNGLTMNQISNFQMSEQYILH